MAWNDSRRVRRATTGAAVAGLVAVMASAPASPAAGTDQASGAAGLRSASSDLSGQLVDNGRFARGTRQWWVKRPGKVRFRVSRVGRGGTKAATLRARSGKHRAVLSDSGRTVHRTSGRRSYVLRAWVRATRPGTRGTLVARELRAGHLVKNHKRAFVLRDRRWHRVGVRFTNRRAGTSLDARVVVRRVTRRRGAVVDNVSMVRRATPKVDKLSNGCSYNARGVPRCGVLVGAAVGSNSHPRSFEQEMGRRLGIHRTYWNSQKVDPAIRTARDDLAAGRLPWISFKLSRSWAEMAAGKGDAWVVNLAKRLRSLPGPVWVAFHHEPEGDGPIKQWTAMQRHLAPLVRSKAPNVAFTIILTGWNQLYGEKQYRLAALWPSTKIDVAGFDVYNKYATVKDGKPRMSTTAMRKDYFNPISAWADRKGIAWGLAETGYTARAAQDHPQWLMNMYKGMKATGGVAIAYFHTWLNSIASWEINTNPKRKQFSAVLKRSPVIPRSD